MPRTDYHCHILPGIDDGPVDRKSSVEMARILADAGFNEVYCTPHLIKGLYEVSQDDVLNERELLQRELEREGIRLKLLVGREYYLDEFFPDFIRQPQCLEGTRMIMIEIPNHASVDMAKECFFTVCSRGYTPMVAHPERCRLLLRESNGQAGGGMFAKGWLFGSRKRSGNEMRESELLGYLKTLGCQFQGNLGSFAGMYGGGVKSSAEYFRSSGLYTHEGTDAHSPDAARFILGRS